VVATGVGHARNLAVAASGEAGIAIGHGWGTLSEIALALKMDKPVVGLGTWELPQRPDAVRRASNAAEAVSLAVEACGKGR
jgi:predicted Rossmann-fold nucleotide-binding protein